MHKILCIMLLGIFMSVVACEMHPKKPFITGWEKKTIPNFSILLPDSVSYLNIQNFSSDRRTILFYLKPSCPYCRAQLRDILKNINKFENDNICLLTTSDFNSMKEFINAFHLQNYPRIRMGIDTGYTMLKSFRNPGVPFTVIVGKDTTLIAAYLGKVSVSTLLMSNYKK